MPFMGPGIANEPLYDFDPVIGDGLTSKSALVEQKPPDFVRRF